jgi:protein required for attachment to host cells
LRTDRPGRAFESVGAARHAVDFASDRRSVEANKFARRIARRLDIGRRRKEFDRIHLIAGPGFLGILRRALSPATTALVIQEAAKNLVGLSEEKRSALLRRLV